jgi:hypothetical protein
MSQQMQREVKCGSQWQTPFGVKTCVLDLNHEGVHSDGDRHLWVDYAPASSSTGEQTDEECKHSPSGKHVIAQGSDDLCQYCEERLASQQPAPPSGEAERVCTPEAWADYRAMLQERFLANPEDLVSALAVRDEACATWVDSQTQKRIRVSTVDDAVVIEWLRSLRAATPTPERTPQAERFEGVTDEELMALEQLEQSATKGPWFNEYSEPNQSFGIPRHFELNNGDDRRGHYKKIAHFYANIKANVDDEEAFANIKLVATMRNALPELIAAIRSSRASVPPVDSVKTYNEFLRKYYPETAEKIIAEGRASVLKEARLAYESHTHKPTEFGGDTCSICGNDIRNTIHLRVGETRESRLESLTKEQA